MTQYTESSPAKIRLRVAACHEAREDGKTWSFYVINDSDVVLDSVSLESVAHEWGDVSHGKAPDFRVRDLSPGEHALIWREDEDEFRIDLSVLVRSGTRQVRLTFEFPKLYQQHQNLRRVPGLGRFKRGWCASAEA